MIKDLGRACLLSILAMLLGLGIVFWAVNQWTSLSSRWINAGCVAPLFGLYGALYLSSATETARWRLRVLFTLLAAPICSAGNFLAFVITSRTWFAAKIAPEHQDFFYQLTHPSVLPTFVERSTSGNGSEQTWMMYAVVGLIAGPLAFWFTSKD